MNSSIKTAIRIFAAPVVVLLALTGFAFGNDHDSKATTETSRDVSKNPITGNTTETMTTENQEKVGGMTNKSKKVVKKKFNKEGHKVEESTEKSAETNH